jgi:hypothetical protein
MMRQHPAHGRKERLTAFFPPLSRNLPQLTQCRLDDDQPELGGSLFKQANLLLAVTFLVILHAFVHVVLTPSQHAIHEHGEFVGHRGHRFGRVEFAAEAPVLGAQVGLAAEQRGRGQA